MAALPELKPLLVDEAKIDWQQSDAALLVAIREAGLEAARDEVAVKITRSFTVITFKRGDQPFKLRLDLARDVEPSRCKFEVKEDRIELDLAKLKPGEWPKLKAGGYAPLQTTNAVESEVKVSTKFNRP